MFRSDYGEVPAVQCGDDASVDSLGQCDHRSIDRSERQVTIARHELGDPDPIVRFHWHHQEVSSREIAEESDLGGPAEAILQEISDLCDDKLRDEEGAGVSLEKRQARFVIAIILVDVGIERPRINDQNDREPPRG